MQRLFESMTLGNLTMANRFIFPPVKTACGTPKGNVTDRQRRRPYPPVSMRLKSRAATDTWCRSSSTGKPTSERTVTAKTGVCSPRRCWRQ